jgi:hypothetical protein
MKSTPSPRHEVFSLPPNAQSNDFLTVLKEALGHCRHPKNLTSKEWISRIGREYRLNPSGKPASIPRQKQQSHLRYLAYFLTEDEYKDPVRTIVVEKEYLSMTFLTDYKNFYATSISSYGRLCSRIHFFSHAFDARKLSRFLNQSNQLEKADEQFPLVESYLGCVTIRPLPRHIVGTTFLKPYPSREEDPEFTRYFPATRPYQLDLLGVPLTVDTLAFISQDKAVGACASFALWMAFHKTYKFFKTKLPTPSEITRQGGASSTVQYRAFPSRGLDDRQVGNVIEGLGLEPQFRAFGGEKTDKLNYKLFLSEQTDKFLFGKKVRNRLFFGKRIRSRKLSSEPLTTGTPKGEVLDVDLVKAHIYAYSRLGVPVLLGLEFAAGEHLIVMSGYRELKAPEKDRDYFKDMLGKRLLLKSRRIDCLYCHDDNLGPFSRLFFVESKTTLTTPFYGSLVTGWPSEATEESDDDVWDPVLPNTMRKRAELKSICIPIEEGIRMDFEDVYTNATNVNSLFSELYDLLSPNSKSGKGDIGLLPQVWEQEWDIYLTMSKEYKKAVLTSDASIYRDRKTTILSKVLPRYVWVAQGRIYQGAEQGWQLMTEMVFDSTETPSAFSCKIFSFEERVIRFLALLIAESSNQWQAKKQTAEEFFTSLIREEHLEHLMPHAMIEREVFARMSAYLKSPTRV